MQTIPLSQLRLSDQNVRKTERDAFVDQLAADIAARGLKQNLVVVPGAIVDTFEVVAGGRRYQAMQLLADTGDLPVDHPVPCMIETSEQAVETSLAENLHRVAMNPADEFDAFRTVIDLGEGDEDALIRECAKRFGVTEQHVRGRLRLQRLAEPVLEALRTDKLTLTQAMAYASVDDTKAQESVFKAHSKPNAWDAHNPRRVRDELAKKTYSASAPKVMFVGLDNYTAAGGRTDIDLFTTDAAERLIDPSIVDQMVVAEFNKQAPKLAKKLKVQGVLLSTNPYGSPKAPDGWQSAYMQRDKQNERIKAGEPIQLLASISNKGKLEVGEYQYYCFVPKVDEPEQPTQQSETQEEREARWAREKRERGILLEAFRLAMPDPAGTPFEDRIFMPIAGSHYNMQRNPAGGYLLEVRLRVGEEELAAVRPAAEAGYDAAIAEAERLKAEAAAAAEAAKAELLAMVDNPPAVIEIDAGREHIYMFRTEDGRYLDTDIVGGDDEEAAEYGCDYFEAAVEEYDVTRWWATRDDWVAQLPAEDSAEVDEDRVTEDA